MLAGVAPTPCASSTERRCRGRAGLQAPTCWRVTDSGCGELTQCLMLLGVDQILIASCRQQLIYVGVCVQAGGLPAQHIERIERMISQLDTASEELLRQKAVAEAQLDQQGIADEAAVRPQSALR